MANLTLTIDDETLRRARIRAANLGTSVDALVSGYLVRLTSPADATAGIAEFVEAIKGSGARSDANRQQSASA